MPGKICTKIGGRRGGITMFGLNNLKVAQKGWLMVLVPLFVSLALCAALMYFLHEHETLAHNNERELAIETGLSHLSQVSLDATSAMMTYAFTKQNFYEEKYAGAAADSEKTIDALSRLIEGPEELKRLQHAKAVQSRLFKMLDELRAPGQFEEMKDLLAINGVREQLQGLTRQIHEDIEAIKKEEERKFGRARLDPSGSEKNLRTAIYIGAIATVLTAMVLAMVFAAAVTGRIGIIVDNANRLKAKESLNPPLSGDDEIACIDRMFRENIDLLAEKDAMERLFIDNSSDVICMLDEAGKFKKINPAVQRNWDYHPDELTGRTVVDIVFSGDVDKTAEALKQNISSPNGASLETRIKTSDGEKCKTMWAMYWVPSEKMHYCIVRTERRVDAK